MKKIWIWLLLTGSLMAFDTQTAAKIYEKIFTAIFPHKPVSIYVPNREYREVIDLASSLLQTHTLKDADIVLITSESELSIKSDKVIFTTDPSIFEKNDNAIGAFYWEHGRPKIVFLQSRLDRHGIRLAPSFQKYIIRKLP